MYLNILSYSFSWLTLFGITLYLIFYEELLYGQNQTILLEFLKGRQTKDT